MATLRSKAHTWGVLSHCIAAALGTFTVVGAPAQAANLRIDDSIEDQITLVNDGWWEFGVTSNGNTIAPYTTASTTVHGEHASFSGTWYVGSGGTPDPGTGIIYFVEPGTQIVREKIEAQWNTVSGSPYGEATISFTIQSSACHADLGSLPGVFVGLGVDEPTATDTGIGGLFRNATTGQPVAIPSNLTIQFASTNGDKDGDGGL